MQNNMEQAKRFLSDRYAENAERYAGSFAHVLNDGAAEGLAEALWGVEAADKARTALEHYHWR